METQLSIDTAVRSIGKLPELMIPKGVCFEAPGEKQIISKYKYFYRGLEEWLKHFVLHKALAPEAIFTNWKHFQGHAMLDSSLLTLVTGLYPKQPLLQKGCQGDDAPVAIWFYTGAINCRIALTNSGILGRSSLAGKVNATENNLALLERFNEHAIRLNLSKANPEAVPIDEYDFHECPKVYLDALASELAAQDEDFDKDYWQPYYGIQKRWNRKIRENKRLQGGCLLPSGEVFLTGENKKIPSSVRSSLPKGNGDGKRSRKDLSKAFRQTT